ncbi:MAG: hypothetical protein Q8O33_11810, partial [Pseudomonadota bacterium]|nr:hypothetical protein [Pseudomonadota bacterium]
RGMMRFAALTTSYGSYFIERGGSYKAMTAEGQNKFALPPPDIPVAPDWAVLLECAPLCARQLGIQPGPGHSEIHTSTRVKVPFA